MSTLEYTEYSTEWTRPTVFYNHTVRWLVYAAVAGLILWNAWAARISVSRLLYGVDQASFLLGAMWPPEFGVSVSNGEIVTGRRFTRIGEGMVETLAMSIVATVAGVILSLPVAVMAAENLAPRLVYCVGRAIVSVMRAIHELIVGIVFVIGFGLGFGAFAGVLALVFATPGFLKLLAEDLEDIDQSRLDAIRATGAGPLAVIVYGVVPQVLPQSG